MKILLCLLGDLDRHMMLDSSATVSLKYSTMKFNNNKSNDRKFNLRGRKFITLWECVLTDLNCHMLIFACKIKIMYN